MEQKALYQLLRQVAEGSCTVEQAVLQLKTAPFVHLKGATVDLQRGIRQGVSEIIYGEGKTAEQILEISAAMIQNGQKRILITRLSPEKADFLCEHFPLHYHEAGNIGLIGDFPQADGTGKIVIATGGTSDQKVAEEAAFTAEALGNKVVRLYDIGVAGLHRLLAHLEEIMSATVIIAIAGMEGALSSVIGGLADCPVIAVPTSVGYGAAFGGVSALLSMLNSCASGVSVVNIDNGFGAAYQASMINHTGRKHENTVS